MAGSVKNYIHTQQTGNLLSVSGQLCFGPDGLTPLRYAGQIGNGVWVENGCAAARLCLLHLLARARLAQDPLDRIKKRVRLGGS